MSKLILIFLAIPLITLVAGAQDIGNNCCNLPGRNCQTYGDWVAGYYEKVYHQCQAPAQSSPSSTPDTSHQDQNRNPQSDHPLENPTFFDEPETPYVHLGPETAPPRVSPVREMMDAAIKGDLPEELNDEQESLDALSRCRTRPWTRWHLHNCRYAA